ncbi:MAG: hypothetical protein KatS3mg068_2673 [Candidatus Sericytochromatia bacterium]|nr:MAG: hypothetical protein KatS3mg068_2673 [Candidatus Sericytochromatia bacterium]
MALTIYYIMNYHDILKINIDILISDNNNEFNGLMILGRQGIGKTYTVTNYLKEQNIKYLLLRGHNSPQQFYGYLYFINHKNVNYYNGKYILILDDMDSLVNNKTISAILKTILDTTKPRIVEWRSRTKPKFIYNGEFINIPQSFEFNTKVIIILNDIPKDLLPIKDRCLRVEYNPKNYEILSIAKEFIDNDVIEFVKLYIDNNDNDLTFRTLKLIELCKKIKTDQWKDIAGEILKSKTSKVIKELERLI